MQQVELNIDYTNENLRNTLLQHTEKDHPKLWQLSLYAAFGENRVKIAPIKGLERCRMKMLEGPSKGHPPYASLLCDYLRATVLCKRVGDMLIGVRTLCEKFTVIRIKQRIRPEGYIAESFD
jgi:hypothetical protein